LTVTPPELHEKLNQSLTGELDTFGRPEPEKPELRPPAWSRIPVADIERMRQLREAQQAT
jgi:hypothetical protein